ncbi:hypothetical protein ACC786_34385 [Rhizobium ruizarguesonis]|uniref:hypothetical protein n=1 Tax=Rhizobium ruizarguesonis TaxID=2081791 RepID=UPI00102F62F3|nr:hypothetical protein [Rhizobium ruizarguesonis]TAY92274.1 hypothetical protein ELH85_03370 [Rhizobium ruizarguesonis]TBA24837.1 hypothetical protein ELH61_03065 [Rhizobium ruizarguesonis]TBA41334.1 hypothetical protein ELH62_02730 [Rhizobium ruizarguesonis]TBA46603.1 hypothetical protein ELH63_02755 [Rhizobium ruizarguesonis]TBB91054.1 hypothetical protein ELH38_02640 [Rhizobium ruizarguesonis]
MPLDDPIGGITFDCGRALAKSFRSIDGLAFMHICAIDISATSLKLQQRDSRQNCTSSTRF